MNDLNGMITLKEYALRHDRDPVVMRQKAIRGGFKTARKIGRDWFINENEPLIDGRIKSGKYVNFRAKLKHDDEE